MSSIIRFSAVILLSIVALSIAESPTSPAFAATTMTLTLNPSNPAPNSLVEFQGTITPKAGISQEIAINMYRGAGCNITQYLFNLVGASDSAGASYSIGMRLGVAYLVYVGPGRYSAFAYVSSTPTIHTSCTDFVVSSAVPEFPMGPPLLLIFALITCGVITRKSRKIRL